MKTSPSTFKSKGLKGLLAALALGIPAFLSASPITIQFNGTINTALNMPAYVTGDYVLTFTYDPAKFLKFGSQYLSPLANPGALQFSLSFGAQTFSSPAPAVGDSDSIFLFNNLNIPPVSDLMWLSLYPGGSGGPDVDRWQLQLVGPPDAFGSTLPGDPFPAFTGHVVSYCSYINTAATSSFGADGKPCDLQRSGVQSFGGSGEGGVEVPEPGTLVLMGLALAGMGLVRRRRTTVNIPA